MPKHKRKDKEQLGSLNHSIAQKKSTSSSSPFIDNRSSTVLQQKLQETADNSPKVQEAAQLQTVADQHAPTQMKENTEMQGSVPQMESDTAQLQEIAGEPVAQRALVVGSYNDKKDIKDLGLWWVMASEYLNSKLANPDLEPIILTLKDLESPDEQEYDMDVNDKLRFVTHGNPGGDTVTNETPTGKGEGMWKQYGMDLKTESWKDVRQKILSQIEIFNQDDQQLETDSFLKPYFCFMKANKDVMDYHDEDLDKIGDGPVFITNHYVLALQTPSGPLNYATELAARKLDLFTAGLGWKQFGDVSGKFPLLKDYKDGKEVDEGKMYQQIFNTIAPQYEGLVALAKEAKLIKDEISTSAPWENLKDKINVNLDKDQVVKD